VIKRKTVTGRPGVKMAKKPRKMFNQPKAKRTCRIRTQEIRAATQRPGNRCSVKMTDVQPWGKNRTETVKDM
jgi:hypothetical protein